MRDRLWVIPLTIIVMIIGAWISRWGFIAPEGNQSFYKDRWLGQAWVKGSDGQPDFPHLSNEIIDAQAQAAINADPSFSAAYQGLEQAIAQQTAIRNANQHYAQEYTRILSQQSSTDVVQLLTGSSTGEEIFIPEEIQAGDLLYEQSSYQLISLAQQKEALWQSARASAERSLYDQAARRRRMAANVVAALGVINLIWLVYPLSNRRRPVASDSRQIAGETGGDENID